MNQFSMQLLLCVVLSMFSSVSAMENFIDLNEAEKNFATFAQEKYLYDHLMYTPIFQRA